MFQSNQNVK